MKQKGRRGRGGTRGRGESEDGSMGGWEEGRRKGREETLSRPKQPSVSE